MSSTQSFSDDIYSAVGGDHEQDDDRLDDEDRDDQDDQDPDN